MISKPSLTKFKQNTRGQILLLAAVAIVLLVFGMITMLNTAAFTEQERATGVDERGGEVIQHLENVEYSMETAIRHANHDPNIGSQGARTDRLGTTDSDGELYLIENRTAERLSSEGVQVVINADGATATDGTRIWQSGYNNLNTTTQTMGPDPPGPNPPDPPGPNPPALENTPAYSYGLINNGEKTRSFTIAVTGEGVTGPGSGEVFMVDFGSHDNVYVYADPDVNSQIIVSNSPTDGDTEYATTATTGSPAQISFTHGTLDGQKIPILPGTEDITDVSIENGGNIDAAFDMVVYGVADNDIGFVSNDNNKDVEGGPSADADELQAHDAVYSITYDITIQTPTSDITTTVRVTPQLPGYADTGAP